MPDVHNSEQRRRNMAAVRGRNTKPEVLIRKGLFAEGFRYRLHDNRLPGRPDLVLPKYSAVIFVNGCFWHGHDCHLFRWPATREKFWREKIDANKSRDLRNYESIDSSGWRRAVVWECAIKGRGKLSTDIVVQRVANWLRSDDTVIEIMGA